MTKRESRNLSYLFFFFSFCSFYGLIQDVLTKTGLNRLFFCILHGVGFILNFRLAVELYRKSRDMELK